MIQKPGDHITNITNNTTNYSGTIINNYGGQCYGPRSFTCEISRDRKGNDVMGAMIISIDGFAIKIKRKQTQRITLEEGYHDITLQNKYYETIYSRIKITSNLRLIITTEGIIHKKLGILAERLPE